VVFRISRRCIEAGCVRASGRNSSRSRGSLFVVSLDIRGEVGEIDCVVCWMEDVLDVPDDVYILMHICPSVAFPYRIMRIVIRKARAQKSCECNV
jgi:hypothetical protein